MSRFERATTLVQSVTAYAEKTVDALKRQVGKEREEYLFVEGLPTWLIQSELIEVIDSHR
jgi:hypothetical protein